jgi:putative membrane protein
MDNPTLQRGEHRGEGRPVVAWLLAIGILPVALMAAGCAPMAPPAPSPDSVAIAPRVSDAERAFMTRAAAGGLYEMEVSRLAAERATSPRVRAYARMVAQRDAWSIDELSALMRAKGVQPPAALAADKATKLQRLAALKPSANFDLGYVRVVGVEDQSANIALFEQARAQARDRDLRAWIDRMLPLLRSQLAIARDLNGSIAG